MELKYKYSVAIQCMTYNHSKYIIEALDGFIMQRTDFPYVILLVDDASTDGEERIISEYVEINFNLAETSVAYTKETEYATIIYAQHKTNLNCFIVVMYLKYNHYQIGKKQEKLKYLSEWFNNSKYIALCEGDDYWIEPLKLQKQVDFLEKNPKHTMCFANAIERYEDGSRDDDYFSVIENRDYGGVEFYKQWIVPTATVLFRSMVLKSNIYTLANKCGEFVHGDIVLFLSCSTCGQVRGMSDVYSIYRRHEGGVTYIRSEHMYKKLIKHNENIPIVFGRQYVRAAKKRVVEFSLQGFITSRFKNLSFLKMAFKTNPIYFMQFVVKIIFSKINGKN